MSDLVESVFAAGACEICGSPDKCTGCKKNYEKPGTYRTDDRMDVILDVDQDGEEKVAKMLRARGYRPEDWEIRSLTVNEWEAMRPTDLGVRTLHQTKAHLTRVVPIEDTPWGALIDAVRSVRLPIPDRTPTRFLVDGAPASGLSVLMGDDQFPHMDRDLHEASLAFLQDVSPDRLIYMGDGPDWDSISRWAPQHPEWITSINDGLRTARVAIAERLEAAGWPTADYLEGNHEVRLQSFLLQKVPALFGLKRADLPEDAPGVLTVRSLLGLDDLGVHWAESDLGAYPYPTVEIAPGFIAAHGWLAKKGAGASAMGVIDRLNASIAVGHTHKLASTHVTRWEADGTPQFYQAVETGAMCIVRGGLGHSVNPDWQNGFATVQHWGDGRTSVDLAFWKDGSLTWRDFRWTVTKTGVRRH